MLWNHIKLLIFSFHFFPHYWSYKWRFSSGRMLKSCQMNVTFSSTGSIRGGEGKKKAQNNQWKICHLYCFVVKANIKSFTNDKFHWLTLNMNDVDCISGAWMSTQQYTPRSNNRITISLSISWYRYPCWYKFMVAQPIQKVKYNVQRRLHFFNKNCYI